MMKLKKLTVALTITLMSTTILSSLNLAVAAPSARELMEAVNARDDGNNGLMEMEMILIDKKGKQRIRKLKKMSQDRGDDSYSLLFFSLSIGCERYRFFNL